MYNVTSCFIPGGLETYYWEMGRALARRGHEVTLVAGARGGAWHDEVRLIQFPFRIEQDWPDFGHRFQRLMERLSFARNALDHLVSTAYDAVVICKPFDFPVMWQARRRGLKAVTVFHTGGTDFFFGDRWFVGAVDYLLGVSRYTARQQELRYGRAVSVVHNGVDIERFHPMARDPVRRAEWGIPADARILISVGRLVGWKGLRTIISALPQLATDVHYLVVGAGQEDAALRAQADALGVADRVHFPGRIAHADLPGVLSESDLYVQPSIGEEAFGISVAEAMSCALPVVASRNGGLPEVVAEGETGWLAAPGDVADWVRTLDDALGDGARLRRMGDAARQRVVEHFTWAAAAAQLENIIKGGR
jgi:glycosyltransferase involved in cell wall biosynthesis